jgi:hypothetical protein
VKAPSPAGACHATGAAVMFNVGSSLPCTDSSTAEGVIGNWATPTTLNTAITAPSVRAHGQRISVTTSDNHIDLRVGWPPARIRRRVTTWQETVNPEFIFSFPAVNRIGAPVGGPRAGGDARKTAGTGPSPRSPTSDPVAETGWKRVTEACPAGPDSRRPRTRR